MRIFVQAGETEVLAAGVRYLRIEGACYVGHRLPVPALRVLPRGQAPGHVASS